MGKTRDLAKTRNGVKRNMGKYFIVVGIVILVIAMFIVITNRDKTGRDRSSETRASYKSITDDEAKKELEKDSNIILLDVRTKEEYDEKHIKGAILIPSAELENKVTTEIPDKEHKIFVYCRTGIRAKAACEILKDLGYTNIYNLGGIVDWKYELE